MIKRRFGRVATATMTAAFALGMLTATVSASPTVDGCPTSGALTSVAYLESLGDYHVPARIDDPANGGNGDGYVCAFLLPAAVQDAWGSADPIYMFNENNRTTKN